MDAQANDQVLAEVLLRTGSGRSLADPAAPVTAANVTQYYSTDAIAQTAAQRLRALGFDVVQQDPLGLTIEGNKALFEHVFHTHLARQPAARRRPPRPGGAAGSTPPAAPEATAGAGDGVDALTSGWANSWEPAPPPAPPPAGGDGAQADREAPGGCWVATQPMVLPASLRDVVDQVVLPLPATLHGG
jgi:hypothetical protein